jgi:hypothetical protein
MTETEAKELVAKAVPREVVRMFLGLPPRTQHELIKGLRASVASVRRAKFVLVKGGLSDPPSDDLKGDF